MAQTKYTLEEPEEVTERIKKGTDRCALCRAAVTGNLWQLTSLINSMSLVYGISHTNPKLK